MSEIASGIKSARTLRLVSELLAANIGDGVDMGYMGYMGRRARMMAFLSAFAD
jgi:hypothetical protein